MPYLTETEGLLFRGSIVSDRPLTLYCTYFLKSEKLKLRDRKLKQKSKFEKVALVYDWRMMTCYLLKVIPFKPPHQQAPLPKIGDCVSRVLCKISRL